MDIKHAFANHAENPGPPISYSEAEETCTGHGRKEIRTCIVLTDLTDIRDVSEWKDAKRIPMVLRQCWEGGKYSEEARYYVGSFAGTAKEYLLCTRKHWGIENTQHYVLDVTFREDDNRTRKDHGPANLALVRRIALSLLHQDKKTKMTTPTKRLHACGNNDYLMTILAGLAD